jgi:3' terminal RNA ribose 2'-O-methyltransferase Hen1
VLLTLSTTYRPATDLGFLLHKNPARQHSTEFGFGTAHVLYPQADPERCTAALIVGVDPVGLVRGRRDTPGGFALAHYVNDRPYAASSFLAVALAKVFSTAMTGRCKDRPELAAVPIPVEITLPVLPCRGGEPVLQRLFAPLGYQVEASPIALDAEFPSWGDSHYLSVRLTAPARMQDVLEHLYVLLPVLDDDKHYWVGPDEVDKLLRRGSGWLAAHPDRELIADRYLRHDRQLTSEALSRLAEGEGDAADPDQVAAQRDAAEEAIEAPIRLSEQRLEAVTAAILASGARRVLDLGCGSGRLTAALLKQPAIDLVVGLDVSSRAVELAARRLHVDRMPPHQRDRVQLLHGSLTYRDRRLQGFDAAAVMEVVEHLDPSRLGSFERVLFGHARPATVVLTTPNVEYNVRFEDLPAGTLRHRDHRFEWTRPQFECWAGQAAGRHGYQVAFAGIGPDDPEAGSPTQMAVFSR